MGPQAVRQPLGPDTSGHCCNININCNMKTEKKQWAPAAQSEHNYLTCRASPLLPSTGLALQVVGVRCGALQCFLSDSQSLGLFT